MPKDTLEKRIEEAIRDTAHFIDEDNPDDISTSLKDAARAVAALMEKEWEKFEERLNDLPENAPLYKDSGSWQVRSDNMEEVICQQEVNESFYEFIARYEKQLEQINKG